MQIIHSVEINYFRSIYQFRINRLKDLNIFVGGNDSGKSNLLRALNLFFNNEVSENRKLDFLQDVTHSRQAEARDAKGRLTIWMKVTFRKGIIPFKQVDRRIGCRSSAAANSAK